jgi:hypothetical protein
MVVSHSGQQFISNYPTLCARQFLAMVLISSGQPQHRPVP